MGVVGKIKNIFFKDSSDKILKELKKEHKMLLKLYEKAYSKYLKNDIDSLATQLQVFFIIYKKHSIKENNLFYTKLLKKYGDYEHIAKGIEEIKNEMNEFTRKLERFIFLYGNKEKIQNKLVEFSRDFEKLGEELKRKIEFEEERLYILY